MKPHIVALTGLSGVGKSTLLQNLATKLRFQHLQASALIRAARQANEHIPTVDHLRLVNLDENQQLLVRGFLAAVDASAPLVVLDAHTLIELPNDTVLIAPGVFAAIGINSMMFLMASAADIANRRNDDKARQRQAKSKEELEIVLRQARGHAQLICQSLGVPLSVVNSNDYAQAAKTLMAVGATAV